MTSRMLLLSAYNSDVSDGEFCNDTVMSQTLKSPKKKEDEDEDEQQISRSTSDPSLVNKGANKAKTNGAIPDYNVPPPYAVNANKVSEAK